MQIYSKVLLDSIEREKNEIDYFCVGADREVLQTLLSEIGQETGMHIQYLAELDMLTIPGAGQIVAKYIDSFSSEAVKGYLLHHLVSDKIKDGDRIVLALYQHFKLSDAYITEPGAPSSAHIYTRYDSAIRSLKPKHSKEQLLELAHYPRDVFYLPFTMKMLASWKPAELWDLLVRYSSEENILPTDVGMSGNCEMYSPPFSFIKRELRFTAINALKYSPSNDTIAVIRGYLDESDLDIRIAAQKVLRALERS